MPDIKVSCHHMVSNLINNLMSVSIQSTFSPLLMFTAYKYHQPHQILLDTSSNL